MAASNRVPRPSVSAGSQNHPFYNSPHAFGIHQDHLDGSSTREHAPNSFLHPYLNRLLLPVDHPGFDPFIHDPLLLPRELFTHLNGVAAYSDSNDGNEGVCENQQPKDQGDTNSTDSDSGSPSTGGSAGTTPSQFSVTDSPTPLANNTTIQEFKILIPVDHPLFDPFAHDTLLWPRRDVVEAQTEGEHQSNP